MIQQVVHAHSRGDTDLVVVVVSPREVRFRAALATATMQLALVGADNTFTWRTPSYDVLRNDGDREVGIRVGSTGDVYPAAGTYTIIPRYSVNGVLTSIDTDPGTVIVD